MFFDLRKTLGLVLPLLFNGAAVGGSTTASHNDDDVATAASTTGHHRQQHLDGTWWSPANAEDQRPTPNLQGGKNEEQLKEKPGLEQGLTRQQRRQKQECRRRELLVTPQRECNQVDGVVTAESIREAGKVFLEPLVNESYVDAAADIIFWPVEHDIQVIKICTSCREMAFWYQDMERYFPRSYFHYCGEGKNGWNNTRSALVFLPLNNQTGKVFRGVKLRPFFSLHPTATNVASVPTRKWPGSASNMVSSLRDDKITRRQYQNYMIDFLPAMTAASSGSLAIIPDILPYGEEECAIYPTKYTVESYEQPVIVTYLGTMRYLDETTDNCTRIDDRATVQGTRDGGLIAQTLASDTLRPFGVKTIKTFAGAAPLDLDRFLLDTFLKYHSDASLHDNVLDLAVPAIVYSYSESVPGLSDHTNYGRLMLSEEFNAPPTDDDDKSRRLLSWYNCPNPSNANRIRSYLPDTVTDVIDPGFVQAYLSANERGVERPCDEMVQNNDTDYYELCRAIRRTSAWPRLSEWYDFVLHNDVSLCYTDDDEVVSPAQYPWEYFHKTMVQRYMGPTGFEEELAPRGDHFSALQYCIIDPILFYNLEGHVPPNEEDKPDRITYLPDDELERCGVVKPEQPHNSGGGGRNDNDNDGNDDDNGSLGEGDNDGDDGGDSDGDDDGGDSDGDDDGGDSDGGGNGDRGSGGDNHKEDTESVESGGLNALAHCEFAAALAFTFSLVWWL